MLKRYLFVMFMLGIFLVLTTPGYAYDYRGIHWNVSWVLYYDNNNLPNSWQWEVYYAKNTWNNVSDADFDFLRGGITNRGRAQDGINVVTRRDMGQNGTLALCWTWYDVNTSIISEFDIEFNTAYTWATDTPWWYWWWYDVRNIVTHEFGHALMLHDLYSSGDSEKTMYGFASTGETKKRSLENDDKSGIRFIY